MTKLTDDQREHLEGIDGEHKFGVLATSHNGRVHLSSIRYALTPEMDVAIIYRGGTQKGEDIEADQEVAFQIDNRVTGEQDVATFARATLRGEIEPLGGEGDDFERVKELYLNKIPEAEPFFAAPDINLSLIRTKQIRFNVGGGKPADEIELS